MPTNGSFIILLVRIGVVAIIGWSGWVQMNAYISSDVGWHLQVAQRVFNGEKLYQDIIEVNMPLVYYMRLIPVAIQYYIGGKLTTLVTLFLI